MSRMPEYAFNEKVKISARAREFRCARDLGRLDTALSLVKKY